MDIERIIRNVRQWVMMRQLQTTSVDSYSKELRLNFWSEEQGIQK